MTTYEGESLARQSRSQILNIEQGISNFEGQESLL
jgi:hypothetical protein